MTKKKRECWEYVSKTILTIGSSKEKRAFDFAFDCAYALGKQEIKQETKQEKETGINGEEILTVKRSDVIAEFDKLHKHSYRCPDLQLGLNALTNLFGSKCLPDGVGKEVNFPTKEKPTCTDGCSSPRLQIAAQLLASLPVFDNEEYPVRRAVELAYYLIAAEKRRPK